jgi:hypothetical protein
MFLVLYPEKNKGVGRLDFFKNRVSKQPNYIKKHKG